MFDSHSYRQLLQLSSAADSSLFQIPETTEIRV